VVLSLSNGCEGRHSQAHRGEEASAKATPDDDCIARIVPRQVVHAGDQFNFTVISGRLEFFELDSGIAIWE
jgi:hypothetical protein